jgi:MarR family transcriptional regulator, temperature-dependent positive regulator of motility
MARKPFQAKWAQWPAPNPDSAAPYRIPLPLARQFQQICATALAEALAGEIVMAPTRYVALATIDDFPGIEQHRLAALINADRTNAVQIVDDLEAAGLVERRVNPADRRSRELKTTKDGKVLRRRLRPKIIASQAQILAPLSSTEQDLLVDFLARVIEANKDLLRPGAGRRRPPSKERTAVRSEGEGSRERKPKDFASHGRYASARRSHAVNSG